jgi:TetR/AcrR family transcriptional regulator, cholesterol catabolism regulator
MGYEVVKTIRGRDYRYAVESYRDPQTGKVRNKWRYLGKADGNAAPRRRAKAVETRARLMSALERLLARLPWADITAHDIAAEADVAPATLYRYYGSRTEVLTACASRSDDELDARLAELGNVAETIDGERARLRSWTIAMVREMPGSAALFALWASGSSGNRGRERNEHRRRAFKSYLERLSELGYTAVAPEELDGLATALALIVQAFSYRVVIGRSHMRDDEYAALATAVERLIFR